MQAGAGLAAAVVPRVDRARHAGTWYEIARYPNRFQRGCLGSRATCRDPARLERTVHE